MSFSYLTDKNVVDVYSKSQSYMRSFFDPLEEKERLALNRPHPDIAEGLPHVTDGTTASIIQKTPRRIIQQLPTGVIHSDDTDDWLPIVAEFIYTNRIIPNANEQFALLQKCWQVAKKGLTFGAQTVYVPFISRGQYFGPDMTIPYVKDVLFEPGKVSDTDSNVMFLRAWYQPHDIDRIIDQEKKLKKTAKERGEEYESTWDIDALKKIKSQKTQKATDDMSESEKALANQEHTGGIEIIHAFQRGIGATFYSFNPSSKTIVRRKVNKDPRGDIPLVTFYADIDGSNPLGWGIPDQVGALQNLIDAEMQMYQYNRALMLNPPIIKRGTYSKSQLKFVPNAIIDLGSDPNANATPLTIDTTAISNFPQNYGLLKSQILNQTSSPDTSISSEVGNPGFSKTPAGVNAIQANVSVDDNFFRKQFETFFERWSETAINLYFAERTGIEVLQLDKHTAQALRKLEEDGKLEPGFVNEKNQIQIDYDEATPALKFEVDASTSNMKNDAMQTEALDGLLVRYEKSPVLQQIIPSDKIISVWNRIVAASGVENPEELSLSKEELEQLEQEAMQQQQMQEQQMMQEQAMQGEQMPPEMLPEGMGEQLPPEAAALLEQGQIAPEEVPEAELVEELAAEEELSPEDREFVFALADMGYSEEQIGSALAMSDAGISEDEIIEVLETSRAN